MSEDMESDRENPKTLRSLLEQFKPSLLDQNGKQLVSFPSSVSENVVPAFLYRVGNAAALSSASSSPSMVIKTNAYTPLVEDSTIRRTRTVIPYSVKCQITKLAEENPRITQGEIAQVFGIDRTTVSKILKRRREFSDDTGVEEAPPKAKMSRFSNVTIEEKHEEEVYNWYKKLTGKNVVVTQTMILEAAETLASSCGVYRHDFRKQWLDSFLDKYKITCKDVYVTDTNKELSSSPRAPKVQRGRAERKLSSPPKSDPSLPHEQRLSQPKTTPSQSTGNKIPRERVLIPPTELQGDHDSDQDGMMVKIKQEVDQLEEIDDHEALSREMGNLEKFREQQKMIEEANKQRKALLAKTLSERQKRAREEAAKLAHIQKELQLLDNRLTADVTVIRSKIEMASRDFLDAQKRYDRAEREFVEAKVDLQKKSELKEQLTEHLYTIIHQNEVRKAKKLSELMGELEMEAKEEGVQLPDLPPLSTFNTITALQALQSPKSPTEILAFHQSLKDKKITEKVIKDHSEAEKVQCKVDGHVEDNSSPVDLSSPTEKDNGLHTLKTDTEAGADASDDANKKSSIPESLNSTETDERSAKSTEGTSAQPSPSSSNTSDKPSDKESSPSEVPASWTLNVVEIKKEPPDS
ncbi:hypothetical protein FSP39_022101 [Pinctada imbricata]|uniref:RAB6-interacting golgin n=1 Tax=Pinctada imbricata TaxID=66713 RepID=A0AA88XNN0_PINIB|nr:hypothetical protein FSP39_022101 [Pinctada imbricata]